MHIWRGLIFGLVGLATIVGGHITLDRFWYDQISSSAPRVRLSLPRGWQEVTVTGIDRSVVLKRFSPIGHDDVWVQAVLVGPASSATPDQALDQLKSSYQQLPVTSRVDHLTWSQVRLLEARVQSAKPVREYDRPVFGQRFHVLVVGHVPEDQAARWRKVLLKILASAEAE